VLRNSSRGFTLIEVMVVLAIIGTLALLVAPSVLRHVGDANGTATRSQVEIFAVALDAYRLDTGRYPSTEDGLNALRNRPGTEPRWRGPYLRKPVPLDAWQRPYLYRAPGVRNPDSYDLYSLGRDGAPGGEGEDADVTSWGEPVKP
jgi:general secretion pathway protein G